MTYEIYKRLGLEVVLSPEGNSHRFLFSASSGSFTTGEFPFLLLRAIKCNRRTRVVQ